MTEIPLARGAGGHWLTAAEKAAVKNSTRLLAADRGPWRWARFPQIILRAPGLDARAVHAAREFALAACRRWGAAERCDDIGIVVSELLTNALRHAWPGPGQCPAAGPIRLGLAQPGRGVLCAVADPSPRAPLPAEPGWLAETGRGLQLVGALSDEWGYTVYTTPGHSGKVVWAMFLTRT